MIMYQWSKKHLWDIIPQKLPISHQNQNQSLSFQRNVKSTMEHRTLFTVPNYLGFTSALNVNIFSMFQNHLAMSHFPPN